MNIFLFGVITILCGHFCVSALCNVQPGLWQRVTSYHFKTLIRSVEEKNIFLKKGPFPNYFYTDSTDPQIEEIKPVARKHECYTLIHE